MAAEGFAVLLHRERAPSFAAYLELLERQARGQDERPGTVPATLLVAEIDGELVGRAHLRHHLDERLRDEGGHVGFGVVPWARGRGHATRILRACLPRLANLGVSQALVTSSEDNLASRRVIERCGGVLADTVPRDGGGRTCRYRLETATIGEA
jgi:predicted acetyltransferase